MEIFKTKKRRFQKFQKEDLIAVLECGYCQKTSCEWFRHKFLASCKHCREHFCKKCHNFKTTLEVLLKGTDEMVKTI